MWAYSDFQAAGHKDGFETIVQQGASVELQLFIADYCIGQGSEKVAKSFSLGER